MPEPPASRLVTHYLLENPWPVAVVLAIVGGAILWRALGSGSRRSLAAGGAFVLAAALLTLLATIVVTAGERAAEAVRALAAAAEAGDVEAGMATVAEHATLAFDRPENPGYEAGAIRRALEQVAGTHRIESNRITSLRAYSEDSDTGVVHLACRTTTATSMGPVPSQWMFRVRRQPDGAWKIERIVCLSIAGRAPNRAPFGL